MSTRTDNLPDVSFAQKDAETILQEMTAEFEATAGRKLHPGDPMRLLMNTFAAYVVMLRNLLDHAAKQNLLKYAGEGYIENLAALLGVERLPTARAVTTLQFTLSAAQPQVVTIPKGTRATPGNGLYFTTVESVDIPAGETVGTVHAQCSETGAIGNGYLLGQVNVLSDPFPFFEFVTNLTETQGGSDEEGLEAFRERIRTAPESFSSAGPDGAYMYWAKTASTLIADVTVDSPEPGVVEVIPLLEGGEIPGADILAVVEQACSPSEKRPLTDLVRAVAPEKITYGIELQYFISRSDTASGAVIQEKVNAAVTGFTSWQKARLGRDINPSRLTKLIMAAGAKRVEIKSPVFTAVANNAVAHADMVTVSYGGLEDD